MDSREVDELSEWEGMLERLRERPLEGSRPPDAGRLAAILAAAKEGERVVTRKRRRRWLVWSGTCLALALLIVVGGAYVYEAPGGIADRAQSRAMGLDGTMHIPLGRTPEEAVRKFRSDGYDARVVHQVSTDGGALLFIKRAMETNTSGLQLEYARHTWLGWKWVTGGGYSIGYGAGDTGREKALLSYMGLPGWRDIEAPFPLMFGELTDDSVRSVMVWTQGEQPGKYAAVVASYEPGGRLWYVRLPEFAAGPYLLIALGQDGSMLAEKKVPDLYDMNMLRAGDAL